MTATWSDHSTLAPDEVHARLTSPARLEALRATGLLDGSPVPVLDRLARIATRLVNTPVALVSLVNETGQYFPGLEGLGGWAGEVRGTPLSHSFCQHVVATDRALIVRNSAEHETLRDNFARTELGVVAYAGVPLRTAEHRTIGALCAIDSKPVNWTDEQIATLEDLASAAMAEIELRSTTLALLHAQDALRQQAIRDPLTGLFNRTGLFDLAAASLAVVDRHEHPCVVQVVNVNDFALINSRFGYEGGDRALVALADVLRGASRAVDLIARTNADEFVVLMPETSVAEGAQWAERVTEAVSALSIAPIHLSVSIGSATRAPGTPSELGPLLLAAESARRANRACRG
jgi:diguanylate cyclase (GGDEF)-like protein